MTQTRKLYVKSYGCQMNVYDSASYGGRAGARGLRRDRDAGRRRPRHPQHLPHPREGGREGLFRARPLRELKDEAARRRPPRDARGRRLRRAGRGQGNHPPRRLVDLVVGPQSYHRLPDMLARAEHGKVVDTEFPVEDKFDHSARAEPRRDAPARRVRVRHRAGRLRQVLHVLRRALHARRRSVAAGREDRRRGRAARRRRRARDHADRAERQRLSRRRRRTAAPGRSADLLHRLAEIPGIARLRYTTSHPRDMDDEPDRRASRPAGADAASASAGAVGLRPHPRRDEPPPHPRRLSATASSGCARARPDIAFSSDFIVGFPGETDEDFRGHASRWSREVGYASAYSFKYSPRPGHARRRHGTGAGGGEGRAAAAAAARDRPPARRLQRALPRPHPGRAVREARPSALARSSAAPHICSRCMSWRRPR